jgi:hypothetical protein
LALESAGNISADRMAMIATTTKTSSNVNPRAETSEGDFVVVVLVSTFL